MYVCMYKHITGEEKEELVPFSFSLISLLLSLLFRDKKWRKSLVKKWKKRKCVDREIGDKYLERRGGPRINSFC